MGMEARTCVPKLSLDCVREEYVVSSHNLPAHSPTAGRARLDAFDIECLIGRGGFGKVFLVRHKATREVYAMKVMEKEHLIERKAVQDAHAERNILAMLRQQHQNKEPNLCTFIVKLHVAFQTSRRVYLVMDFASGGELMFHLRREAMLSEEEARFYAAELLIALESLHEMDICHRDIKPENVLLDGDGHLVLTDFGLAKEVSGLGEQAHSWCGSEDYMAPETLAREAHSGKAADFWAYGVFLYDCLCGEPPFSPLRERGKTTRKQLHERILKCKYRLPKFLSRECHSLLRALLVRDPAKRLCDVNAIRKHAWFRGVDWNAVRTKKLRAPILPFETQFDGDASPTACFSPSLTKASLSAPHSPAPIPIPGAHHHVMFKGGTPAGSPTAAFAIANAQAQAADSIWEGFSFVAPGMEVHFQLAQPNVANSPLPSPSPPPSVVRLGAGHGTALATGVNGLACTPPMLGATQGFQNLHFENAAAAPVLSSSSSQNVPYSTNNTSVAATQNGISGVDELAAELAEFSVDAAEAVEICE